MVTRKNLFIYSGLSVCLVILGVLFYLSSSSGKASSPVYEEIYSQSSELNRKLGLVDHAIYESLYQRDIDEKDIYFTEVSPRHEKGQDWDFTGLLIELSGKESLFQLEKIIDAELYELRPGVNVKKEEISGRGIVYNVYTMGLYTHKLRLVYREIEKISSVALPRIAIIIDDLGYDLQIALSFINYDLPLSLSILPIAPYTSDIVKRAKEKGCELLLHQPMEPKDYPRLDPGPGALITDMGEKEIREMVSENIKRVPGLKGVNNHMGSYFSERFDKMKIVLSEIKRHNLFYVDSRTTNRTVAFKLAREMGVPVAKKSVFLDNDLSAKAIRFQVERLMGIAEYSGEAVGIGHPHQETLEILYEYQDKLKTDFRLVPVSELVK